MSAVIETLLPPFLMAQRWFGEKASPIASVAIEDSGTTGDIRHLIVTVQSVDGGQNRYYAPVSIDRDALVDATHQPEFHHWLSTMARDEATVALQDGRLVWESLRAETGDAPNLSGPARVLAVEQSNTSVRFGNAVLVKILRRLQAGANPEIELTRFLTEKTDFHNAPALLGTLTYVPRTGERFAIAVAQTFVPSISDGWTAMLSNLTDLMTEPDSARADAVARSHRLIERLGRRTAEFHLALSSDPESRALAPEVIDQADVDRWREGFKTLLDRVSNSLHTGLSDTSNESDLIRAFLASKHRLTDRAEGFDCLIGAAKIRVHGDYHLGQVLLTPENDWFLIDFEGEPRRTLAERRAKTSPLKDVAGMLRSFSYARGTMERATIANSAFDLISWERGARAAFLNGYLAAARASKAGFLPGSDEEFRLALETWELDKAIYEIDYELNNRPNWLWLPLSAALKFA